MCWGATRRLIMQCFGFAVPEVSTESLLIDQPAVRSDTNMHQPVDGLSMRMEAGGIGVSSTARQPTESAVIIDRPAPESDPPAAAATSFSTSPLLQPMAVSHHPQSSPIVQSLEMYNGMFSGDAKGKEEADSVARAAGVEPSELHIEACAICCDDIILGPNAAVLKMKIPEGERPAHFACGHALHKDCFAIYACSSGWSCPICKLEEPASATERSPSSARERTGAGADVGDDAAEE
eukprot:CAMPEP_0119075600 /NCGR_PEP_ID=MMETSP1178-20130426/81794_1 /TAXON_ID=33656 /ORGANISM="unid sp, Strain CCMP2000" /LENGTH=235 /DNA_ID=CAMNT_0007057835 /DNA_START=54 /DNA_END=758 /DNA_ORIENTATION=-